MNDALRVNGAKCISDGALVAIAIVAAESEPEGKRHGRARDELLVALTVNRSFDELRFLLFRRQVAEVFGASRHHVVVEALFPIDVIHAGLKLGDLLDEPRALFGQHRFALGD